MATRAAALTGVPAQVARKLVPVQIGPTIDKLDDLREAKRKLMTQVDELDNQYRELEEALMDKFEAEGSDKGSGKHASASITRSVVGNVTDWDALNAYVKKTGYFHLYQKRLSDPAVRELFEQGKKVPGCEPFTKRRLNLLHRGV